jgi:hypothetical protein
MLAVWAPEQDLSNQWRCAKQNLHIRMEKLEMGIPGAFGSNFLPGDPL